MKVIKSTGNAEEDAKLLAEASGISNQESLEEAKKRSVLSNSGKESGNSLVATPRQAGETLLVIRDGKDEGSEEQREEKNKVEVQSTKQVNESLKFEPKTKE